MKIGNHADKPAAPATTAKVSTPASASSQAQAVSASAIPVTADPSAKIELSSTASTLLSAQDGTFDAEKVARISKAIEDGSFTVNHEAIADKLISNAQELLTKVQP